VDLPGRRVCPAAHLHPARSRTTRCSEGEFEVLVGDDWQTLRAGESASVPVGVNHTFRRPKAPVRVRNFHRPALGFEDFIETTCGALARQG
jgi:uncharacterized cupin superfamily protein